MKFCVLALLPCTLCVGCSDASIPRHELLPLGQGRTIPSIYAWDEGPASVPARIAGSVAAAYVERSRGVRLKPSKIDHPFRDAFAVYFDLGERGKVVVKVTPGAWTAEEADMGEVPNPRLQRTRRRSRLPR
jgi:hypothetical protein